MWISVKDRLPEENGLYLVIIRGIPLVKGWDGIGWREHQFTTPLYENDCDIAHWCKIEPPEDDK